MSAKDRLWHRLPTFIWGEGSVGLDDVPDEYSGTEHLVHTRHPRFLCEYDDDEEREVTRAEGTGASLVIRGPNHCFYNFVYIDAAPDLQELMAVCQFASLCRSELDCDDDAYGEDGHDEEDCDECDHDCANCPLAEEGIDRQSVRARSKLLLAQDPAAVAAGTALLFPPGWRDQWQPSNDEPPAMVHRDGWVARRKDEDDVTLNYNAPFMTLGLRLFMQARHLLLALPEEELAAEAAVLLEQVQRRLETRTEQVLAALPQARQDEVEAAKQRLFPAGWKDGWSFLDGVLGIEHRDGWRLTQVGPDEEQAIFATRHGIALDDLRLDGGELVGEREMAAQGLALLMHAPDNAMALQATETDKMPGFAETVEMIEKQFFQPGWRDRWTLSEDGKEAWQDDEARFTLTERGLQVEGDLPPEPEGVGLLLQARALLSQQEPASVIRASLTPPHGFAAMLKASAGAGIGVGAQLFGGNRTAH